MSADYTPEQRSSNQRNIVLAVAALGAIVLISGLLQSWKIGSFVVAAAVILICAAVVWNLFAARSARPLSGERKLARWQRWISKQ